VAGSDLAADTTIDAKVAATDAAGNVGQASSVHTHAVDVTPPVPTITLNPNVTADDIISSAEAAAGNKIAITGTVGGDAKPGDTVTLTVNGKDFTGTVAEDKSFSIEVPGSDLAADQDKTIDAKVTTTDAAGNTASATATDSYSVVLNQNPVVSAPLLANGIEDAPAVTVDLLQGASDPNGDALSVSNVTYSVNGGAATTTAPAGVSVSGSTLTVDTTQATGAFETLAAGQTQTIKAFYTISDGKGGTVSQTATTTITGVNDAPVITSTTITNQAGLYATMVPGALN